MSSWHLPILTQTSIQTMTFKKVCTCHVCLMLLAVMAETLCFPLICLCVAAMGVMPLERWDEGEEVAGET